MTACCSPSSSTQPPASSSSSSERTPTDFDADHDRRDTLLWNITVLGEAITELPDAVKAGHPQVGWNDPVRLRNRIVHGYWSIDLEVLVATARDDLPGFIEQVRTIEEAVSGTN